MSAGIAPNPLLARLALKKAKPNGVACAPFISAGETVDDVMQWISQFNIVDIPSIGWSTASTLKEHGITNLTALQSQSKV
jgi:DNA repair protein REV1